MADTIEKIYCTDGRDNDLAAILAATKNNDPATMMVVDKTPELLVTLNPALKKEQETETRLKAVEGSVREVKDLVKTLVEKLS